MNYSDDFSKKYCDFYKGMDIQDDVTQPFWYSMKLEKDRLINAGISKKVQIHSNDRARSHTFYKGSTKVTMYNEPVAIRKNYCVKNREIAQLTDYYAESRCTVFESDKEITEFTCPHCGHVGTRESFVDGCDYCGSLFKVGSGGHKVSSYNVFHDYHNEAVQRNRHNRIAFIALILIFIVLFMISFSSFVTSENALPEFALKKISFVLAAIAAAVCVIIRVFDIKNRRNNISGIIVTPALAELEHDVIDFNREEFAEALDYKLKTVHYSKTDNDYEIFLKNYDKTMSERYEQVLECNLKNYSINWYKTDDNYRYIGVTARVKLVSYEKNRIVSRLEEIKLSMCTRINRSLSDSMVSYSCNSCGNSVSLLKGGVCEHCHEKIDLAAYDWVITDYLSDWANGTITVKPIREKMLGKTIFIAIATIILISIPTLASVFNATLKSFESDGATVYAYHNEFIPAFSSYGYAIIGRKAGVNTYEYKYVGDYEGSLTKYANDLVSDDGFTITKQSDTRITLIRHKRFGFGSVEVTIIHENGKYTIKIW